MPMPFIVAISSVSNHLLIHLKNSVDVTATATASNSNPLYLNKALVLVRKPHVKTHNTSAEFFIFSLKIGGNSSIIWIKTMCDYTTCKVSCSKMKFTDCNSSTCLNDGVEAYTGPSFLNFWEPIPPPHLPARKKKW